MIDAPFRTFGLALAVVGLVGCASGSGGAQAGSGTSDDRNVVTEAQLVSVETLNVFEALQRLKPAWLRARGASSLAGADREGIRVYVDRVLMGDVQSLRSVAVRNVQEMRFLDSRNATREFGTDHGAGAILVTTRRGR
jgi:hypothetical protein